MSENKKEETKEKEVKTEGKAVDQDGNEVKVDVVDKNGKPIKSWKDHLKTVGKILLGVVVTLGAGIGGAAIGGSKVRKEKDKVIRSLNSENLELHERIDSLESQMTRPAETEDEEETF